MPKNESSVTNHDLRIGFIGAGQMATALAKGFVNSSAISPQKIVACDLNHNTAIQFTEQTGGSVVANPCDVLKQSETIFLAVKPKDICGVLSEIRPFLKATHVVVSIAAGVTLTSLTQGLLPDTRIIRVMPNTPCLVGCGAIAFACGTATRPQDVEIVSRLLSSCGLVFQLPESLLDAVTGLSGSGPAFVYQIIEALSDGGVRVGLPREIATSLAAQTVLGAAQMVISTGKHPGVLKDAVTSPGGTTIAGLHVLEQGGLRGTLMTAVQVATERAYQLAQT